MLKKIKTIEKDRRLGHRERLRARFEKVGYLGLHDYEILELVLFLSIPRGDVKAIAKNLLYTFKSLSGVLHAEKTLLKQVHGIGPATIHILKVTLALQQRSMQENIIKRNVLSNFDDIIKYCRSHLSLLTVEEVRILFLDHKMGIIRDEVHQRGTVNETALYTRELLKRTLELGSSAVILIHNHPSGNPEPSMDDIQTTYALIKAAKQLNIDIYDHIITAKDTFFSFKNTGLLKGV
ncbi:MAG: hypothetical protein COY39_01125 [Alphaproteobacteria bacterium CG_4_10_14_0_8_um_filter_37_21]|nr:MAG: hypothetical protein COY39_01125 [Alphaproteobacteria bacterium CG_4_10_14_0_8_um_filter_37_21]